VDVFNTGKHLLPFKDLYLSFLAGMDIDKIYRLLIIFYIPIKTETFKFEINNTNLQTFMISFVKFNNKDIKLLSSFSEQKRIFNLFTLINNRTDKIFMDYTFSDQEVVLKKFFVIKLKLFVNVLIYDLSMLLIRQLLLLNVLITYI